MRNPRTRRNISAAVLVVGIGYVVALPLLTDIDPRRAGVFGTLVAACLVSVTALIGTIAYSVTHGRHQRLLRGERLLVRWTLSPAEWAQFRENERNRASRGKDNAVKVRAEREATGIDVVITEESLMVDDDFYHLGEMRGLQWLTETPPCLDFRMVTPTKGSSVTWHIRFPAPVASESLARVPWDVFQKRLVPRDERSRIPGFRIARRVSVIIAIVSAAALLFAWRGYGDGSMQSPELAALIGGFIGFPLGTFTAALTHWWLTRGPGRPLDAGQGA